MHFFFFFFWLNHFAGHFQCVFFSSNDIYILEIVLNPSSYSVFDLEKENIINVNSEFKEWNEWKSPKNWSKNTSFQNSFALNGCFFLCRRNWMVPKFGNLNQNRRWEWTTEGYSIQPLCVPSLDYFLFYCIVTVLILDLVQAFHMIQLFFVHCSVFALFSLLSFLRWRVLINIHFDMIIIHYDSIAFAVRSSSFL